MWCEHDPYVLFVFRDAFHGVRFSFLALFHLIIIQLSFLQDFLHFRFADVAASHAATGMFAVNDLVGIAWEGLAVRRGYLNYYWNAFMLSTLVLLHPKEKKDRCDEGNKWQVFFKHAAS